jgi:type IV pilus assembly protein PilQ
VVFSAVSLLMAAGSAIGAQTTNQLLTVKMEEGTASPTVLIQTAEAVGYRYTVYDSFDPVRVVVDFPGMELGKVPETIPVGVGLLKELKIAKFDLASGSLARVEIVLAGNADYQVALDEKNFRIVFPGLVAASAAPQVEQAKPADSSATVVSPPAATAAPVTAADNQPATIIREVAVAPGRTVLSTNGSVGRIENFTLGNPPRLVVDLYGLRPGFKQRSFSLADGMKSVRVGAYNDKVRFVFDADGTALPEHVVDKQGTAVVVSWGKGLQTDAALAPVPVSTVDGTPAQVEKKSIPSGQRVSLENLEFENHDGRSYVVATLSAPAQLSKPVQDGKLIRFEIRNATISRTLRRTIDASAFPSVVKSVTPYAVKVGGKPAIRIAIEVKGSTPFALEDEGRSVKLVVDDGSYAEATPPDVSTKEVVAAPVSAKSSASVATSEKISEQQQGSKYSGQKITLVFDNADIRSILQLIGDVSGLNIVASDDVKGDITLRLIDVPWDQALDLVLETSNLKKDLEGSVLRVMTVKEASLRQSEKLKATVEQVQAESIITIRKVIQIQYVNMDSIKNLTDNYIKTYYQSVVGEARGVGGNRVSVNYDKSTKKVMLTGPNTQVEDLARMIYEMDVPQKQVMIECRIVEAKTNFLRELGVNWGIHFNPNSPDTNSGTNGLKQANSGLGGSFFLTPPVSGIGGGGSVLGMTFGNLLGVTAASLDVRLSAMESAGDGKVVSTPKVLTISGSEATIEQGRAIPYTTVSDSGTDTKFKDAKLVLKVTPEINPSGTMILDLDVSNDSAGAIVPTGTGTAVSIETKKAKTKLMLKSGETTVVGGVYVDNIDESEIGVPLLKEIPFIGHFFKSTRNSVERREILIFITPRILDSLDSENPAVS